MVNECQLIVPKISVLMAVYNENSNFLRQAIQSVLEQTFTDFEFIIIDDGSDDRKAIQILKDFEAKDARIRLFREPHRGLTKTLNVGLSYCRGEFICRQDSDDWSAPNRFNMQVKYLLANPEVGIVGSYAHLVQENGKTLWVIELPIFPDKILDAFKNINPFCHGAVCFRRREAIEIGGYREDMTCAQDYDYLWRMCEAYGGYNLPIPLYYLRVTRGSVSTNKSVEQMVMMIVVQKLATMRNAGEMEDLKAASVYAKQIMYDNGIVALGELKKGDRYLLAGYNLKALVIYLKTLLRNPLMYKIWLKILRWAVFISIPPIRKRLFSHHI